MNDLIKVRKIVTHVENIFHEGGPAHSEPIKKGAVLIVLENPYAGSYVEDITPMMEALKPVGLDAAKQLIELLGGADQIQSYGKGSIVGEAGELEHGALWHVPGGYAMREALGGALAIVHAGGPLVPKPLGAGDLHHCALGGQAALEYLYMPAGLDRIGHGMDNLLSVSQV
mgnify:CR=1 FL=1